MRSRIFCNCLILCGKRPHPHPNPPPSRGRGYLIELTQSFPPPWRGGIKEGERVSTTDADTIFSLLVCFLWLLLFAPTPTLAGHGFTTAFANIEWLPEPGRTPDSFWYFLDGWREERELSAAAIPEEKVKRALAFAREKLAEVEAMVKDKEGQAAKTAAERYRTYVDRALMEVRGRSDGAREEKERLAGVFCQAVLEHQYILSVIYEDLPQETRTLLPEVVEKSQAAYKEALQLLPPQKQGAFFWREDEVRWAVQAWMRDEDQNP